MKIVTVNIPKSYILAIEKLIGEDGLYPSRSELVRCAVREFLIKELRLAENMIKHRKDGEKDDFEEFELDAEKFIRIPLEKRDENDEPKVEFKTYKIVRSLNNSHSPAKSELKTSSKDFSYELKGRIQRAKEPQGREGSNVWYDDVFDINGNLKRSRMIDELEESELIEYLTEFEKVNNLT